VQFLKNAGGLVYSQAALFFGTFAGRQFSVPCSDAPLVAAQLSLGQNFETLKSDSRPIS
jgi:hypothetical protein